MSLKRFSGALGEGNTYSAPAGIFGQCTTACEEFRSVFSFDGGCCGGTRGKVRYHHSFKP